MRKALIEHYEAYKGVYEVDAVSARYWENIQIPYLVDHVDMPRMTFSSPTQVQSLRFRNILTGHIALLQQKVQVYATTLESVDRIRSMLVDYEAEF